MDIIFFPRWVPTVNRNRYQFPLLPFLFALVQEAIIHAINQRRTIELQKF